MCNNVGGMKIKWQKEQGIDDIPCDEIEEDIRIDATGSFCSYSFLPRCHGVARIGIYSPFSSSNLD